MKLSGSISISRCHGSGTSIHISIIDETSGCEIVDGFMSVEAFGHAVSGGSHQPFEFELRPANAGKTHEHKQELVDRPDGYGAEASENAKKIIAPLEVDGWRAQLSDATNRHRWVGKDKVRVSFHRYVDATQATPEP